MAFSPYDTNLWGGDFGMVAVSYPRKNINTMAVLATPENIGALSLEFDAELRYYGDSGLPYFTFWAKRNGTEQDPAEWEQELLIKPGVWLVVLKDEFRTFRQPEFENTFEVDHTMREINEELKKTDWTERKPMPEKMGENVGGAKGILDVEGTQIIPAVEQPLTEREKEILANSPDLRQDETPHLGYDDLRSVAPVDPLK